jgi:cysteine desulfuration protein SufE
MTLAEKQDQLLEELALFQDWTERYEYVIGLGRKLPPMDETVKNPEHLIKGCQSQVWLDASLVDGIVRYTADSDSLITKGMIALFVRVLDGEKPDTILTADMGFIDRTGLKEHLAPTRANALNLMATQMKQRALAFSSGVEPHKLRTRANTAPPAATEI